MAEVSTVRVFGVALPLYVVEVIVRPVHAAVDSCCGNHALRDVVVVGFAGGAYTARLPPREFNI